MRRAILALSLVLGASQPSHAEDRALLVGIGHYRISEANLPGVDEDLTMMREAARKLGFADSQIKTVSDSQATLRGIRDAIDHWLVDGTTAGDRALYYHSGHGSRLPDSSGDEADGSDEVLLPYDFEETQTDGETRLHNVLLDDELGRLLARIPAREVVVLVDSCHSGTITRSLDERWTSKFYGYSGMPPGMRQEIADRELRRRDAIILLSAARSDQDAQTSTSGALFTQGVWKAVREAAPRRQLTLDEIRGVAEAHIRREVGERTDLLHQPMLSGGQELRSINLFLPQHRPRPAAMLAEAAFEASSGESDLWHRLETVVRDAGQPLEVAASKGIYRIGESLELSIVAPGDGYVYVLNVGDRDDDLVMLYPNRHRTDHRVRAGETVHLPAFDVFQLPARLPSNRVRQRNLVVAVHTALPLDLDGAARGVLERLLLVGQPYAAGQVVVTIAR